MHDRRTEAPRITVDDLMRVGDGAFEAAREEHRRKGVPIVFVQDGKRLWELPDGTITDVDPFAGDAPPRRNEAADRSAAEDA